MMCKPIVYKQFRIVSNFPGPDYSTSIDMGLYRMNQPRALFGVVRYAPILVILSIVEIVCVYCASAYKIAAPLS
jgi:hypothetical protein